MASLAEIRAGLDEGPAWLLALDVGGRVYRVADRAVTVTDAAGRSHAYTGGLGPIVLAQSDQPVMDVPVEIDIGEDWALQVARGIPLVHRIGTLRRWWPGQELEAAEVVITGQTIAPEYGGPWEPLTITLTRDPFADSAMVLDHLAVVDGETWPDDMRAPSGPGYARDEGVEGQCYPLIFGFPGHDPERGVPLPAVPALMVQMAEGLSDCTILVADRPINATKCAIYNIGDGKRETWNLDTMDDGLEREITYAYNNLASSLDTFKFGQQWWFGLQNDATYGGGIVDVEGRVIRGAGDVITWMLERSGIRVDWGRMAAAIEHLNRYMVDTYINSQISAWEWISEGLLPLLPVVVAESTDGLYFRIVRWGATTIDATARLSADRGQVSRVSRIRTFDQPIRNEIEVRYRGAQGGKAWHARRIISASDTVLTTRFELQDDRIRGSYLCRMSQVEHGLRPWSVDCPWTWDHTTADLLAEDMAARYAWPKRSITYQGGWELEAIEPWSVVAISDSEIHLDAMPALVQQRTIDPEGITLDLILLDHPAVNERSTV